ncbi:hypothetical protein LEP1GSC021_0348 [Leptospira noguchii str. 1993005606]|uniref:Uncharacterized protein n=1 Tax=Leptospira noguchii serovar Autumnalis str. ZUN142 TaxID=1085540 RepID=M6U2U9_9LEPT|nr:hypothetical protein LEP1GSC186_2902 [Leptospira noguchii serovar Autumnalis str. ZUN142]EPE82470.1 hypothetical protein LEP1GSC021_0348 [Leptospira noguchii str. 1993005606]
MKNFRFGSVFYINYRLKKNEYEFLRKCRVLQIMPIWLDAIF